MWKYLLVFLTLTGCASMGIPKYARTIQQIDSPLIEIQKTVARTLPLGLATASANGREMYSKRFILVKGKFEEASDAADRYFATVTVLGDMRPYTLEIFVTRENRVLHNDGFSYAEVGHDLGLAHKLEKILREELAKRREDRNIIDDFRVF